MIGKERSLKHALSHGLRDKASGFYAGAHLVEVSGPGAKDGRPPARQKHGVWPEEGASLEVYPVDVSLHLTKSTGQEVRGARRQSSAAGGK